MLICLVFSSFLNSNTNKPITISMFFWGAKPPIGLPRPGPPGPRPWRGNFQARPCQGPSGAPWPLAGPSLEITSPRPEPRRPWPGEADWRFRPPKNIEIVMGLLVFDFQNHEKTKQISNLPHHQKTHQYFKVLALWGPNLKCNLVRRISYFSLQSPI